MSLRVAADANYDLTSHDTSSVRRNGRRPKVRVSIKRRHRVCGELLIPGKSVIRQVKVELSAGWSLREPANDGRNFSRSL